MTSFEDRIEQSHQLEVPFIDVFNEACESHEIVKFGFETTQLRRLHRYIRYAEDVSSHFVRYLPDSVLIKKNNGAVDTNPKTALIEFKVQNTLVRSDGFFARIQNDYGEHVEFPLSQKDQVFGTEKAAHDLYRLISSLGVIVVVVAWQSPTSRFRAQYVDKIVICNENIPGSAGVGSGTPQYNTHIDSYIEADQFFEQEFGIDPQVLERIKQEIIAKTPRG